MQWLGELWRKYHQVFTLLDPPRLADVERDFGAGFNPFDVHRRAVIALETLVERPELTGQAVAAGIDLLVVDEAQRLRRPPGHPGEPAYRAIAPIAALGRHVLLLSATPLEDDAHGFFRLLQLLRPDEFPEALDVEARLASGVPLPPCTSSTRRVDIGGLPPRVPIAIDLPADGGPRARRRPRVQARLAPRATPGPIPWRPGARSIASGGARSGAALKAVLGPDETELRQHAEAMDRTDPRLAWLVAEAARWRRASEKTLVFVAHRETLEMLRDALSARAQLATGVFHEDLSPARRDIEVARFRVATDRASWSRPKRAARGATSSSAIGWSSTICRGSRGRRAAHRPARSHRPPHPGRDRLLPSAVGHRRRRRPAVRADRAVPRADGRTRGAARAGRGRARGARARSGRGAVRSHAISSSPPRRRRARGSTRRPTSSCTAIRIAPGSDRRSSRASRRPRRADGTGRRQRGLAARFPRRAGARRARLAIEFGNDALIDCLPGVPGGSSFLGSFDRDYAVEDETIDFFASGHRSSRACWRTSRRIPRDASPGSNCASPARPARARRLLQGRPASSTSSPSKDGRATRLGRGVPRGKHHAPAA